MIMAFPPLPRPLSGKFRRPPAFFPTGLPPPHTNSRTDQAVNNISETPGKRRGPSNPRPLASIGGSPRFFLFILPSPSLFQILPAVTNGETPRDFCHGSCVIKKGKPCPGIRRKHAAMKARQAFIPVSGREGNGFFAPPPRPLPSPPPGPAPPRECAPRAIPADSKETPPPPSKKPPGGGEARGSRQ